MNDDIRILITDDSEINLEIESALIENRWGIPCDTAISGEAAIKFCNERIYSLILMDYLMPIMSGTDTAKAIKNTKWNFRTPVIGLTGSDDEETAEFLIKEGFAKVLIKPIDEESLAEVFKEYLGVKALETGNNSEYSGAILAELYNVQGLDVTAGLKNVAGNRDSYVKSLRLLKDKIPEANERINNSLLKSDMERARMYLHSMKSGLANVGFAAPGKLAADLEHAVIEKNADYYDSNIGAFSDRLDDIGKALEKVFARERAAVVFSRSGNEDEFIKDLRGILEEFDNFRFMEAKELADVMSTVDFGQKKNKTVTDIITALDSFDYDKATSIIKAALA
jgi:CheY-like chemotaxis protein/HPt (histidine-containing phosphotransfer) domain-containing protein